MYVVAEGSIEVYKGNEKVNTLGPGKVFGELALLYNSKRNATILGMYNLLRELLFQFKFLKIRSFCLSLKPTPTANFGFLTERFSYT